MQNKSRTFRRQAASVLYAAWASLGIVSLVVSALQPAAVLAAAPQPAAAQNKLRAPLFVPALTATKADALFTDVDGDTQADPGDVLQYTVTLTNTGSEATGVVFTDTLDANLTLVTGSINVAPLAVNDVYTTVGNTLLEIGVVASGNPAVNLAGSLFTNDAEFLGDTFSLTGFSATSAQGGEVAVNANGSFTYLPPVGFTGTDTFTYTVADGIGATDGSTVTVNVVSRVWYVRNNAAAGGNGRSSTPFDTLAEAETASAANDTIYVLTGDGITTGQNAGFSLKNGQRLLGQGVALSMPVSVDGVSPLVTLQAASMAPQIGNAAGNGVSIVDVLNVQVQGLNIGGTANAVVMTTTTTVNGTAEIANNIIRSAGLNGVDVNQGGSGTLTLSLHDNTVTATGNGLDVQRTAGSLNITALDDNVISGATGGTGINIVGTGATILLDSNPGTPSFDTVSGGTTVIGQSGSGNGVGAAGFILDNARGDLNFADLDIYTDNGRALFVDGTTANYTGSSGLRFTANSGTATLVANGGAAAQLQELNVNLVLASLTSTNSTATGVSLFDVSGTFTAPAGSSITNATGVDFSINGNSTATANVSVSYAGTITDDAGTLVQIQNVTGSSTHVFSGAITDGDDGDGSGVSLTNNSGAAITFSGGLVLATGGNAAFTATGGGIVNVCDENPCNPSATGALINKLTTTTGTALNVANTTIGANGLTFRSISSNGGSNTGIILNTTGTSGGLTVMGTGSAGSGGTIANKTGIDGSTTTGIGLYLNSTSNVSLNYMQLNDFQNFAIFGTSVTGFRMANSVLNGANGDNDGVDEGVISFGRSNPSGQNGLFGASAITDTLISGGIEHNVQVYNQSGTFSLSLTRVTIRDNTVALGSDGVLMEMQGTASATLVVENSDFIDNKSQGIQVAANDSSTADVTINNSRVTRTTQGNEGFILSNGSNGDLTARITNNTITGIGGVGIFVGQTPGNATASTSLTAIIRGNTITHATTATNHAIFVALTSTSGQVSIANILVEQNTIAENSTSGVARGILVDTPDTNTSPSFTASVLNNSVSVGDNVNGVAGIVAQARQQSAGCFDVRGNTVTFPNGTPVGVFGLRVRQAGTATAQLEQGASAGGAATVLAANNLGSTTEVLGTVTVVGNSTCQNPPAGLAPHKLKAHNKAINWGTDKVSMDEVQAQRLATRYRLTAQPVTHTSLLSLTARGNFKPIQRAVLSGENINLTLGTLPVSEKYVITFRATVDSPFPTGPTQVCNQGTFTGSNFSNLVTNDPDTVAAGDATCTPIDVKADLSLTKTEGGVSAQPGETVVYTLNYTNAATSTVAATNALITETLPANTTYADSGWTLVSGSTYTRSVGTVAIGASGSVTFAVTVNNPVAAGLTLITNTASIGFPGPEVNAADNTATDTTPIVAAPDMQLSKDGGGVSVAPGDLITYTLTYTNAGNQNATGVVLTETVPANTAFAGTGWSCTPNNNAGSTCTRAIGGVNGAGGSGSVPFVVQVITTSIPAGIDQISNTASVADDGANGADATPANNTATDTTPLNAAPDYVVSKTDGVSSALAGQTLTYTVTYSNTGNQDGTGVTLTEAVPAGTAFNAGASTAGWTLVSGSTYTYNVGALAGGAGGLVTFGVTVDDPVIALTMTNTVSIADDGANGADPTPANNNATDVNIISVPPVLDAIGNKTVDELVTLAFTATATDGNAPPQTLTFSLDAGAPSGASIDGSSGEFSWTPTELQGPGAYTVTVRVTDNGSPALDDFETITITVNDVNAAPVLGTIGNQTLDELVTLAFTVTVADTDVPTQTLTFSLDAGAPSGASIDGSSGTFSWTPTEAQGPGVYTATVRVTDNGSPALEDFETITITVNDVNSAPVLGVIGPQTVDELVTLTFTATVTDTDVPTQTLTFSLDAGAPSGASIDGTSGAFSWTPTEAQGPGIYTVTVRVTDNGSPTQNDFEDVVITVNDVNSSPVLDVIGDQSVNELTTLVFTATATDDDTPLQALMFSLDAGAPSGASIDGNSGEFSWTPTELQGPGAYTVTVRVADDGSPTQEDFETITIVVNEVNVAPTLGLIGPRSVTELTTLTFTATVTETDVPPQTLTFSLDAGAPSGTGIGGNNGVFNWTPSEAQGPGVYTVTVRVTDNGSPTQSDFEDVVITVNEANLAPVADDDAFEVEVDSLNNTLNVLNGDTDADLPAQTLTIVAIGPTSNGGALFNNGTTLSYTPTAGFDGTETFTYTVSDGNGATDTALVTVTVSSIRYIYLPLVGKNYASAPDLVVQNLTSNGSNVQVVLANQGSACVTSAAEEFWVDVYVNPTTPPTAVNQIWSGLSAQGLVWGVTSSAFPLCPGQTLTLTVGDAYYSPLDSVVSFPLPDGTPLYAQVDSFNPNTTYGSVRENHEIMGGAYNNIRAGVVSITAAGADWPLPPVVFVERERDVNLPKRPN